MTDTNDDAITSLARIATASIRWMEKMRIARAVYDPDEELDHIQANLDRIARQLKAARHG